MEAAPWDFFERLERLEPKVEEIEPRLENVNGLSLVTFELFFIWVVSSRPSDARKWKDVVVEYLKTTNMSKEVVERMNNFMLRVCDKVEERT